MDDTILSTDKGIVKEAAEAETIIEPTEIIYKTLTLVHIMVAILGANVLTTQEGTITAQ